MRYSIDWDGHPQDVLVRTEGPATVEDAKALIDAVLEDERYRPGAKVLIDHTGLDEGNVTDDDVREVSQYVRERRDRLAGTIVAVVAPSQEHYGFSRMWRTYAQQELPNPVGVFYSREAAAEWLLRMPATTS